MKEYFDEEFSEKMQHNHEQLEGNEINFQTKELLEITENDYQEERTEYAIEWIAVTSVEKLQQVIDKAEQEKWETLGLRINNFQEIPAEIGKLINVKHLHINKHSTNNKSILLPPEIGNLKQLEVFDAYGCDMVDLPEEFGRLMNLKSVNLNHNNFTVFPKEILSLEKLESLAIDFNFKTLPDEICNLVHLKYLYFPKANISYLPDDIGNLQELEVLCIWGTKVNRLPDSCQKLKKIKSLYLTKSIFEKIIPPEIISQSPLEVINYIVRYQNDTKKIEVNESKMLIVGQGGVGKTCLLNRLKNDKYDETVSTEGIAIEPWEFEIEGKKYKLNTWDFGGQEIYHATHQFFLTNRSLYIFVWDARQEEEYGRIDYWLHTIESFAYNSPIIIVVNKCDSRNSIKQLDLKSIKEKFPQVIDSFRVSCKMNIEIEHLRNVIEEETTKLPLMGMVWLSSWLDIRIELENLAQNTNMITYKEYQKICCKYHVLSGEALSLSKYLHDLGIIINFQNDLFLKNIVILKPDWGTKAVYKVLDAQDTVLKNRNGILFYDDLPKIWEDTTEYPEEIYPIILRLMENFQLSFEVNKNREYLIAELLENEEVLSELNIDNKQTLNFQYNYEFLPAGVMTRFIVKANAYLVEKDGKKACWKKGAYLKYEDSIGVVKLFDGIAERKIEIKVIGESSRNNRDLLIIIRKYFDEIHKSVSKIKYREYVRCNCEEHCTYLHDYRYLLRLEEKKIKSERCKNSLKQVNVCKLLDGVEDQGTRNKRRKKSMSMPDIQVNPQIIIKNDNTNNSENSNINSIQNLITIEIKNSINEMQGSLNDLKDEIVYENSELGKEFEKMEKSIEKLDAAKTKDEIIKSGALNKVKRFLIELQDTESEIGKAVRGIKYGVKIAQDIGEKYNSIAEWCGLPVIPKVFLKG
ncbi:COR domain-containing protein [Lachnospiraceae bacterium 62-35]